MFSAECPQCGARFQIKNDALRGERKPCPKCRQSFELGVDEVEFEESLPPRKRLPKAASKKSVGKKRSSQGGGNALLWIGIGCVALLVLVGVGFLVVSGLRAIASREALADVGTAGTADDVIPEGQRLTEAKAAYQTRIISSGDSFGPPDVPAGAEFELVQYQAPIGGLAAYVTPDPGDGQKHPAIVWITGGDCNSIGDVWTPNDRSNDQSARAFRQAGIVMMFPSLRGGNANPGRREGFYNEVEDILAATEHLAALAYVDPSRIYLGGHSTGGTLVLLVAASTDRFKGVFSLGPVATPAHYGGDYIYCDLNNDREIYLRSPIFWLQDIESPTFVFEGASQGNWESIEMMQSKNKNTQIQFFRVPGHDHFSVIAPLTEFLAAQVVAGELNVTPQAIAGL
jgi:predicted Zn finger-like uncharacterized protein